LCPGPAAADPGVAADVVQGPHLGAQPADTSFAVAGLAAAAAEAAGLATETAAAAEAVAGDLDAAAGLAAAAAVAGDEAVEVAGAAADSGAVAVRDSAESCRHSSARPPREVLQRTKRYLVREKNTGPQ